jgi:hypothetical protein
VPVRLSEHESAGGGRTIWPSPHITARAAAIFRAVGVTDPKARVSGSLGSECQRADRLSSPDTGGMPDSRRRRLKRAGQGRSLHSWRGAYPPQAGQGEAPSASARPSDHQLQDVAAGLHHRPLVDLLETPR